MNDCEGCIYRGKSINENTIVCNKFKSPQVITLQKSCFCSSEEMAEKEGVENDG